MSEWKNALNKFLQNYVDEDCFEGALLCGSYASGNQDEQSDIDVQIVTANTEKRRERGNCYIDGFLIEYFINPVRQIERYLEDDYKNGSICNACMFGYGQILYDKNGEMKRLKELSADYLSKSFPEMGEDKRKMDFYHIWDDIDEMKSLLKKGLNIDIVYVQALLALVKLYCAYHRFPQIVPSKLERILSDQKYAKNYHWETAFPAEFSQTVVDCIRSKTEDKPANIERLYQLVASSCGGFDIGCFKLNTPVE